MKPKQFFIGRAVGLILLLVIVLGVFIYKDYFSNKDKEAIEPLAEEIVNSTEPPVFTWRYEEDASLTNPDGFPSTNIFIEAKYRNGTVQSKFIEKVAGGCNALPDSDADSLAGSENIQCYYAGLGYTFKITKGENSYRVERKMFEEGSPEYTPPVTDYEVVLEFPLITQ